MGYKKSLNILHMDTLKERKEELSMKFAQKCFQNSKTKYMLSEHFKVHEMLTRKPF